MTRAAASEQTMAPVYRRVAIKWLVWEHGLTEDEAATRIQGWPDHRKASEAIDVATFIVDECHGS